MHARIASFEGGDTEKLRQMNEERMKSGQMEMPDGVTGAMVLVTPDGSRRMFITFFETREQLDAAEEQFDRMGDEIPEDVRGRRTGVERYEVVWNSADTPTPAGAGSPSA